LKHSILAKNSGLAPDCAGGGGLISQGYNILGDDSGCSFVQANDDHVGQSATPLDPKIDPLASNGGLTKTHALQTGSIALEGGDLAGCTYEGETGNSLALVDDQRGLARPWDSDADGTSRCDIGAYEKGGCGDAVLDTDDGEECDDGTKNSDTAADACRTQCKKAKCGDKVIDDLLAETCDDGNVVDGDGCSALCQTETDADGDGDNASVDCNDSDPLINTKTTEKCDGVDNDCDKETDEGFSVGESCTNGVGACQATGSKVCAADGLGSTCNATAGTPGTELCGNAVDDDCDAETDEGFDVGSACSVGVGACNNAGQKVCTTDGQGTECNAAPLAPSTETCNDVDDNCDGATDEEISATATTCGVGACAATGSKTCQAGKLVDSCTPAVAGSELCGDSLDNDCDGTTDEGFDVGTACSIGVGACAATGTKVCSTDKTTTQCSVTAGTPTAETCDGLDNDCDGTTDEDIAATATTCGVGACAATGSKTCQSGKLVDSCTALATGTETCGDGIDQDCNGSDLACPATAPVENTGGTDTTGSGDATTDDNASDDSQTVDAPVTENVPATTDSGTTTETPSSGGCSLTGTPEQTSAAPFTLLLVGLGLMTGVRSRITVMNNK
jgi:cysteine-rich repeat protein